MKGVGCLKKSKGSTLVTTICFIAIMLSLTAILSVLAELELLTSFSISRVEKLRSVAEGGIERGIAFLKDTEGSVPSYPGNIITFDSYNGTINCYVTLYDKDYQNNSSSVYTVTSLASSPDNKFKKNYIVRIDKKSFKDNFYLDSILNSSITVLNNTESIGDPFKINSSSSLSLFGPLYIQGNDVNVSFSRINDYRTVNIKAKNISFDAKPEKTDSVYADIPEDIYTELRADIYNTVQLTSLYNYEPFTLKSFSSEPYLSSPNLIVIKKDSGNFTCSFSDIQTSAESLLAIQPVIRNGISTDLWNQLIDDDKKAVSSFINKFKTYKIAFVHGNLCINEGTFNNYLLLCDGKITVKGNVTFNNSSVICRSIEIDDNSHLSISCPDTGVLRNSTFSIKQLLKANISGYNQGTWVRIVGWEER
jgi:hypothetical protein